MHLAVEFNYILKANHEGAFILVFFYNWYDRSKVLMLQILNWLETKYSLNALIYFTNVGHPSGSLLFCRGNQWHLRTIQPISTQTNA